MTNSTMLKRLLSYLSVISSFALLTWILFLLRSHVNPTTIGFSYLLYVLVISLSLGLPYGILASVAGALCYNYFFFPPYGTFTIEDPQNWVALGAFLVVAIVVSQLTSAIKSRALEAETQHDRASKLYSLSRAIIATPDSEINVSTIAKMVFDIYDVDYCSLHVPDESGRWQHVNHVSESFRKTHSQIPDIGEKLQSGAFHPTTISQLADEQMLGLYYSTIEIAGRPIGVLAIKCPNMDKEISDATAGVVALALERARYIAGRKLIVG